MGGGVRCSIVLRFEMAFCRDFFSFLSFFSGSRKKVHPGLLADVHNSKHTVLEQLSRVNKAGGGAPEENLKKAFTCQKQKRKSKGKMSLYMYMYLVS